MYKYVTGHFSYLIKSSKYEGVDLLRCFAVLGVVFFHYDKILYSRIFRLGWTGVDLFFILSGFLIGGAILDEYQKTGEFRFLRFYKNRVLRIYPVYIFATLLTIYVNIEVFKVITFQFIEFVKQFTINLLFLQTYIPYIFKGDIWNPAYTAGGTWSLVIEWFFYLVCPVVLVLLLKKFKGNYAKILIVFGIIYLSGTFVRLYVTRNVLPDDSNWYFAHILRPHMRYDELVAGVICAMLVRKFSIKNKLKALFFLVSCVILCLTAVYYYQNPIFLTSPQLQTWETLYFPVVLSIAFSFLLLSLYNLKIHSPLVNMIARLSYPMYLIHMALAGTVIPLEPTALVVFNFGVSYLVSLTIEYPFLRLYRPNSQKNTEPKVIELRNELELKLGS